MFKSTTVKIISKILTARWMPDLVLAIGLFLGALAIRLPYFMTIPAFTDETMEVLYSLRVFQGNEILLTNLGQYYGSLYNYILAAVFYVWGISPEKARLTVTVMGAATVPLAYFFAKTMEDRLIGIVVALMMLTSGGLIVMGHVAYENNMTPFFATATLLVFALALKRNSGKLLVSSGLLFGLTLQTHPSVSAFGLGLLIYFIYHTGVFSRRSDGRLQLKEWLRSPWPHLTILAGMVGYANVIVYNIIHPLGTWTSAQQQSYAFGPASETETYLTNMQKLGLMIVRMTAGTFEKRISLPEIYSLPLNILFFCVLIVGIFYAINRSKILPIIVLAVVGLIVPYFNKIYGFSDSERYVGYLYPLLYLLIATPLIQSARAVSRSNKRLSTGLRILVVFMIVAPALNLVEYYRLTESEGITNEKVVAVSQALKQQYQSGGISEVIIDDTLGQLDFWGGGNVRRAFEYLLTMDGVPHRTAVTSPEQVEDELRLTTPQPLALILFYRNYEQLSSKLQLSALGAIEVERGNGSWVDNSYGIYVVETMAK